MSYIADCKLCQDSFPSHDYQTTQMAMDFAYHAGQYFLIVVDCLTDWFHICPMSTRTTSSCTINLWLKSWGIYYEISSPYYNGKAEATIKSMKQLIMAAWKGRSVDCDVLAWALLQYRNTPCRRDVLSSLKNGNTQQTQNGLTRSFTEPNLSMTNMLAPSRN